MSRIVFEKEDQIEFFRLVRETSQISLDSLAKIIGVVRRTYSDWSRGRFLPTEKSVKILSDKFCVQVPKILEIREEWWSGRVNGRKAALARMSIYGPPGTLEGRKKGGRMSQIKRRDNPEYYRELGCNIRHGFRMPEFSQDLAEFVGIILGDGSLTAAQLKITLNSVEDAEYIDYVRKQANKLFDYQPSIYPVKTAKAVNLVLSGVDLVENLVKLGLKIGNKVENQVGVPDWINENDIYERACLRGLMDTDGGILKHNYFVNGKHYSYLKICFTNNSKPLRDFVFKTLNDCGFSAKSSFNKVWLYSEEEVRKYVHVVGSSNYRLWRRFEV